MHFQSLLIAGLSASTIALTLPKPEIEDVVHPHIHQVKRKEITNADVFNTSDIRLIINTGNDGDLMDSKDTKMGSKIGAKDDEDIDSKGTKMKLAVGVKDDKDKDENENENEKVKAKGEKDKDVVGDEKVIAKGAKDNGQDEEKEAIDGKDLSTKDRDEKISADKGDDDEVDTKTNSKINYGKCSPAMSFKEGRPGRKPDESTFLPDDPLVAKGQQDALNPNIITNRICDQLVNVCEANDAAIKKCQAGKAKITDLGTRDETTAKAWNDFLIV